MRTQQKKTKTTALHYIDAVSSLNGKCLVVVSHSVVVNTLASCFVTCFQEVSL